MEDKFPKTLYVLNLLAKGFAIALSIPLLLYLLFTSYRFGYTFGFRDGRTEAGNYYTNLINESGLAVVDQGEPTKVANENSNATPTPIQRTSLTYKSDWGGPNLWEAVNDRRKGLGVNPLSTSGELCTIASIRLNELLELGKLDNHEGFSNMPERRSDLVWIFDKYSTIAEFLAFGGQSAEETVSLWENTLGHKKLLSGGEYVWGCIYAQNSFAVAITAF